MKQVTVAQLTIAVIVAGLASVVVLASVAFAGQHLAETRYCGPPARDEAGAIVRSSAVTRAFRGRYACPSTGEHTGSCPHWEMDHVIPLVCHGCDSVSNLQWLPSAIKSAAGSLPKDRWERGVYCRRSAPQFLSSIE